MITIACNGAGGRVGFEVSINRAGPLMRNVMPSSSKLEHVEHLAMPIPNPEIDNIERQLGVTLPGMYRKLLVELGPGIGPVLTQIYHPNEIRELYEPFFDDPLQLFAPYFPFGCDNQKQELWVIDADRELAASIWQCPMIGQTRIGLNTTSGFVAFSNRSTQNNKTTNSISTLQHQGRT